ncbi:MAG: hypothetical protein J0M07_21685 [Anaerolineae bacterium]|jgi:nucleoside 2-deoxyribosyltransferase|nr:hypothetical protein [Anaerolineae bacterium]
MFGSEAKIKCAVCRGYAARLVSEADAGEQRHLKCAICGEYWISSSAERLLLSESNDCDHRLAGWIRHHQLHDRGTPQLDVARLRDRENWLPELSISARTTELLRAIAGLSKHPGARVRITHDYDWSIAYASNASELLWHMASLRSAGLISTVDALGSSDATLTPLGWQEVESGPSAVLPRAFVAMSFSDKMRSCWNDGLKPGIEDAGYAAHRVDSDRHVQQIDQKIVADIRTSQFVVTDVTEHKQGVYFEAGLALGFGKTVIWTVRKDELAHAHFDTRQFAHICWETHEQLREQLRDTIVAVLGAGPNWRPAEAAPSSPQP